MVSSDKESTVQQVQQIEDDEQKNKGDSEEANLDSSTKSQVSLFMDNIFALLKKWFTVPEEEKQKKETNKVQQPDSIKKDDAKKEPEKKPEEKPVSDYEQELKRIEHERKQKQQEKRDTEDQIQKQKAIQRVRKAQEKQKRKLEK